MSFNRFLYAHCLNADCTKMEYRQMCHIDRCFRVVVTCAYCVLAALTAVEVEERSNPSLSLISVYSVLTPLLLLLLLLSVPGFQDEFTNTLQVSVRSKETSGWRGDYIEVFEILNGYKNIHSNMFFSLMKDSITWGNITKRSVWIGY